ncbi:arylamine N-acetyltransferase [Mesorhizobium sp. VK3C]|nr:arylamine N-acetyltransferase [Mesorhizobium sp. VK3C]
MLLRAYLDRIGYQGPVGPTLECLRQIHLRQVLSIPYENIDVQLGVPVDGDIERIFEKVVVRRRGGWCYELNALLGWALSEIGFDVMRASAGVLRDQRGDTALGNHLILLVRLNQTYLVDEGLGDGIREPIPLMAGTYRQGPLTFRLAKTGDGYWRFHSHSFGYPPTFDFRDEYADEPLLAARCAALQKAPESTFVQNLICQIMALEAVTCLTGRVLRVKSTDGVSKRLVDSPDELAEALDRVFGIRDVEVRRLWPKVVARHDFLFGDKQADQIEVAGM